VCWALPLVAVLGANIGLCVDAREVRWHAMWVMHILFTSYNLNSR